MKILDDLKAFGYSITLEGENIRLKYLGRGEHPVEAQELIGALKVRKAEAVEYLKQAQPLPYLDLDGSLIISFGCDGRFHYWNGGQSLKQTEREVKAWVH